eukprot:TRINITY_DN45215_c0_g1_i1.p1 TRINITY_DN45215_c0_g1~~TRINITY_DN45215_c0_g1_i1.p1  ORF type:complete len:274 (-),score=51.87 TRINITY_DN45215_c0_g1_i1:82-903(-)
MPHGCLAASVPSLLQAGDRDSLAASSEPSRPFSQVFHSVGLVGNSDALPRINWLSFASPTVFADATDAGGGEDEGTSAGAIAAAPMYSYCISKACKEALHEDYIGDGTGAGNTVDFKKAWVEGKDGCRKKALDFVSLTRAIKSDTDGAANVTSSASALPVVKPEDAFAMAYASCISKKCNALVLQQRGDDEGHKFFAGTKARCKSQAVAAAQSSAPKVTKASGPRLDDWTTGSAFAGSFPQRQRRLQGYSGRMSRRKERWCNFLSVHNYASSS